MSGAGLMDDEECISRYLDGEAEAMHAMVEKHRHALYGFVRGMTGQNAEADEVFQETWIRALRALPRYRARNFRGWLLRIAHNVVIDRARKRRREVSMDGENADGVSMGQVMPSAEPGPDSRAADFEIGQRIEAAVGRLPPEQREVFALRMRAGITFREIAVVQRASINTVLARMQYALRKLREELRGDYLMLAGGDGEGAKQ